MIEFFVQKFNTAANGVEKQTMARLNKVIVPSYKTHLRAFGKFLFDVYARNRSEIVTLNELQIRTNIAQLNFFKWAYNINLIEAIISVKPAIQKTRRKCCAMGKTSNSPVNNSPTKASPTFYTFQL